jgi:hypothetical protein
MNDTTQIGRAVIEDAPSWCSYYSDLVKENSLIDALGHTLQSILSLEHSIPDFKEDYQYEPNKWSVKRVLIHLIDTERYYAFLAMCISRKIVIELNQEKGRQVLAVNDRSKERTVSDISMEFAAVRNATIALFANMNQEMLDYKARGNRNPFTARSIGWTIAGHTIHHRRVLEEKYLGYARPNEDTEAISSRSI